MELAVKKVRRQSRLIEKQDDDQISFDV